MAWLSSIWRKEIAQPAPCAAITAFHMPNMFSGTHGSALVACPSTNLCFVMCLLLLIASPKHRILTLGVQAGKKRREIIDSDARKQKHRIQHSAPGTQKVKPARKKKVS